MANCDECYWSDMCDGSVCIFDEDVFIMNENIEKPYFDMIKKNEKYMRKIITQYPLRRICNGLPEMQRIS